MHHETEHRSGILFVGRVSEAARILAGYGAAGVEVMEDGIMVRPFAREN